MRMIEPEVEELLPDLELTFERTIATIENKDNPAQAIAIKYLRAENAFVTDGIRANLGEKEILLPVHLIAKDLGMIGAILSAILEKISQAHERDMQFKYVTQFEVMGTLYGLKEQGDYIRLEPL